MSDLLELEIATPHRQLVHEQVSDVQIPGKDGYLGILPGHAALLGMLGAGALSYAAGGGPRRYLAIDGGFLEVLEDHVRVLADSAERAEDINVDRARSDLARAQEQLASTAADADPAAALAAVNHAQARIDAAERR
ncbi:MAG: ATP synthase F1 subunit epsilon [Bryobacteraceae bacterium]|jgi:F-type H+-transporting ATPase subunit epsilon